MLKRDKKIWDVIVIGGGASGMFAACIASQFGKSVLIIEKNKKLGEKLKITGGGRCNITNYELNIHKLLAMYGDGAPFLYSPFSVFGVKDTFEFFESRGLPLVIQSRNRVFPKTQRAVDVYEVLYNQLTKSNVNIYTDTSIKKINTENDLVVSVETNKEKYYAKSFILATGGVSHPTTGSTGDGFDWLRDLGHQVSPPTPNIVPLGVSDSWVKDISGVNLSFMKITFFLDGKKKFSKKGKILFTHFGISGPLILNNSSKVSSFLQSGKVDAYIDLFPDTHEGKLNEQLIKIFDYNKNKKLSTVWKEICPDGMSKAVETIAKDIDFNTKVHSVNKEDRMKLVHLLKALPMHITNLMGYDRAVVADGGVNLKEIDTKTMVSKKFNNLYITGDLIDVERHSGGYSLQICWTTGYVAGKSA